MAREAIVEFGAPVFVIGNPRSGTTMLRLILASHRDICIPPECGFALWLEKSYKDWGVSESRDSAQVVKFLGDLNDCRKFDTWKLDVAAVEKEIAAREPDRFSRLVECVYLAYLAKHKPNASRWGDKNNFHVQHIDEINRLFPDCQFVHIVRDVRDVACSYRELKNLDSTSPFRPNLPFEIRDICDEWIGNVSAVLDSFADIDSSRKITVRYEDIVTTPEDAIKTLCDFLKQPCDAEMLDFHQRDLEPVETMDWKAKTKSPVSTTSLGRFRSELKSEDIKLINSRCADLLRKLNYSTH